MPLHVPVSFTVSSMLQWRIDTFKRLAVLTSLYEPQVSDDLPDNVINLSLESKGGPIREDALG